MVNLDMLAGSSGQRSCALCRDLARGATSLNGEQVCAACLRRLNADPGAKRAIMFAHHD